jgi:hypothetical protein
MGFLGMRGTGDWATDQRPKSYREGILMLYPNGSAPLTAIMSKLRSEALTDPEFYWWTKTLQTQRATITGVYTDASLLTAYTSLGVAGDVLYVKMSAADVSHFRIGHQVLLRDASDYAVDVNAKVIGRNENGASSYIQVKLLEADDNSTSHDLSDADVAIVIGSINAEGAIMPSGITYDPVKMYNYTQIFRSPLSITRTARKTKLRTGDAYKEMKREALEYHSIEMERNFLFGVRSDGTGDNGKPERTMDGIITILRRDAPANVNDYTLNTDYSGKDWTEAGGGETWLNAFLELMFRYGAGEKLALCGSGALLGINALAQSGSHFTMTSTTRAYGINVTEWITPFGTIYLKTHPLFSMEATLRNSMLIVEPKNLIYKYIDDTNFYSEANPKNASTANRKDATDEEFLTEASLELHHPTTMGFLNGVGSDNSL